MVRLHHLRGIASVSELKKRPGRESGLGARVKRFRKANQSIGCTEPWGLTLIIGGVFLGAKDGCAGVDRSGWFLEQQFTGPSLGQPRQEPYQFPDQNTRSQAQ